MPNDPTLSQDQVNTLVSWANNGAPEGDEKDKPAPVAFQDGWNIKPDLIVEMPSRSEAHAMFPDIVSH